MKAPRAHAHQLKLTSQHRASQRGMALMIVLSILVLLSALLVALLQRAGSDKSSSSSYKASTDARLLADTAVNLVQGQINQATSRGSTYAWASQPGAIRVFNNNGDLTAIYRLYSSPSLTTTSPTAAKEVVQDDRQAIDNSAWSGSPALWVDLNSPATNSTQGRSYPILDPRQPSNPSNPLTMDGFANNTPGTITTATQSAPMPVRWLYVLQNGQIITPDTSSTPRIATFNSAATKPSQDNPIVGRIAFWTDDETCKVNINTASGDGKSTGTSPNTDYSDIANKTFWDTPHFASDDDFNLASKQPYSGEFQRYCGHPATVALNNVLNGLGLNLSSQDFYKLTPRYKFGGSQGATQPFDLNATAMSLASDRLYSSVAEMLFSATRSASVINSNNAQTRQGIETARFFLTAHSRAPEVNLYGKPRICIWPLSDYDDSDHRTYIDQLLAFDSTVKSPAGNKPYYFARRDSFSATTDISLTRNTELLNYLDNLTKTDIPGFGHNFSTKYGEWGMRQILTEIFDYVRITNLKDPLLAQSLSSNSFTNNPKWYGNGQTFAGDQVGSNQVTPSIKSDWGNTQGFGAFPRLSEISINFVCLADGDASGTDNTIDSYTVLLASTSGTIRGATGKIDSSGKVSPGYKAIQAFMLMSFTFPAQIYPHATDYFWVETSGLDSFTLSNSSINMGFPAGALRMNISGHYGWGGPPYGDAGLGYINPAGMLCSVDNNGRLLSRTNTSPTHTHYTLYSDIIVVPTGTMNFTGGKLSLTVFGPNLADLEKSPGDTIQTIKIDFGSTSSTLPVPTRTVAATPSDYPIGITNDKGRWGKTKDARPLIPNDVVRSMILSDAMSDARLLARSSVSESAFATHPKWSAAQNEAHSILEGRDSVYSGTAPAYDGKLVAGATYPSVWFGIMGVTPPVVPTTLKQGGTNWDWDSGIGCRFPDGPWINKTDEGSTFYDTTPGTAPYFSWLSSVYDSIGSYFSPNRQIPSPGMFGSLSTGVTQNQSTSVPWRTLLFRPPADITHLGNQDPKDHLLLDLFWMPIAEPYAISEPFSSAGKINLNYQIVPFTYLTRSTAVRAALAGEKIAQVKLTDAGKYKYPNTATLTNVDSNCLGATPTRLALNLDATLEQFQTKFSNNQIFRSASEICQLYLVPKGSTLGGFTSAWYGDTFAMVGDNVRERPYANIYGKITTKSNTFTVYYTVQSLKSPTSVSDRWDEDKGGIVGEYRGSTILERFIDPNAAIPDYATNFTAATLESYYKWRVVANHQFAP